MRPTTGRRSMRSQLTGWLLLAPTLLILFVFGVVPFIYVLVDRLLPLERLRRRSDAALRRRRELPPARLRRASSSIRVWLTLRFAFFAVASEIVLGYFLAQLFMRDFPLKGFFRTIHALPLMVAPIAVGATWRLLTVPGLGPLPYYLDQLVRHRLSASAASPTRRSDHGRDGYLALDAARHADAARRALLDAEGAVRAGADRRRQPLPDLLAHHPAAAAAGDPGDRVHPA